MKKYSPEYWKAFAERNREQLYQIYLDGIDEDAMLNARSQGEFDLISARWDMRNHKQRGGMLS